MSVNFVTFVKNWYFNDKPSVAAYLCIVSLAAVFWMSHNVPPKQRLLTSELHSFLIVLEVCLRSIEKINHIPENLNDVKFRVKMLVIMSVETPKKIVDETSKCFTCSSHCPGKERVYIFGKTALEQSNRSVFQSKSLDSQKNGKKGSGEVWHRRCFQGVARESSIFLFLSSHVCCQQEHKKFHVVWKPRCCRICFVKTEKLWNVRHCRDCRYSSQE